MMFGYSCLVCEHFLAHYAHVHAQIRYSVIYRDSCLNMVSCFIYSILYMRAHEEVYSIKEN